MKLLFGLLFAANASRLAFGKCKVPGSMQRKMPPILRVS